MARYDDTFVDRFLEPWNRHDVDGALALMTDDCVWEVARGGGPHGTLYTGRAAVNGLVVDVGERELFRREPCRGRTPGYRHAW